MTHPHPSELLRAAIERAVPRLEAMSDAEASVSHDGKWSAKQLVGHLTDSACNNHGRFVRAQGRTDLVFDRYDQEHWTGVQDHASAPWAELVAFWRAYNLHLARIVAAIPAEELTRPRSPHSVPGMEGPVTLEFLIVDYVDHLQHHLGQIRTGIESTDREPMSHEEQNIARTREYLDALGGGATGETLAAYFTPDAEIRLFPNRLLPNGSVENLDAAMQSALRGQQAVEGQRYEIKNVMASGDRVALEVRWTATTKLAFGTLPVGGQMAADFAIFLEFRDGRIARQHNYDCFEPF